MSIWKSCYLSFIFLKWKLTAVQNSKQVALFNPELKCEHFLKIWFSTSEACPSCLPLSSWPLTATKFWLDEGCLRAVVPQLIPRVPSNWEKMIGMGSLTIAIVVLSIESCISFFHRFTRTKVWLIFTITDNIKF